MIRGCKDEAARSVFDGENPKGFPSDIPKVARRKLRYLNAATHLEDEPRPATVLKP
jgi:toxin HigB-1